MASGRRRPPHSGLCARRWVVIVGRFFPHDPLRRVRIGLGRRSTASCRASTDVQSSGGTPPRPPRRSSRSSSGALGRDRPGDVGIETGLRGWRQSCGMTLKAGGGLGHGGSDPGDDGSSTVRPFWIPCREGGSLLLLRRSSCASADGVRETCASLTITRLAGHAWQGRGCGVAQACISRRDVAVSLSVAGDHRRTGPQESAGGSLSNLG